MRKSRELALRHLARGHDELAMLDFAGAAHVPIDAHVVGRIGEHHLRRLAREQPLIALALQGVGAEQPMLGQEPQIPHCADRRGGLVQLGELVCPIRITTPFGALDQEVYLGKLEPRNLDIEVQVELAQRLELDRQRLLIPLRQLGQPVVRDPKGLHLARAEMADLDRRHLGEPEPLCRFHTGMAGDDPIVGLDHDGDQKAELADARRKLLDLLWRMLAWVALVRSKLLDRTRDDVEVALDHARNPLRRVPLRHALRASGGLAGLAYCGSGGALTRLTGGHLGTPLPLEDTGPVGKEKPGSWHFAELHRLVPPKGDPKPTGVLLKT